LIRKIDGASFYALATGHEQALAQLYGLAKHGKNVS